MRVFAESYGRFGRHGWENENDRGVESMVIRQISGWDLLRSVQQFYVPPKFRHETSLHHVEIFEAPGEIITSYI